MNTSQILHKSQANQKMFISSACLKKIPKVLVAEENIESRSVTNELLDLYDVKILKTENGEEAVDFAVYHRPNLIILDPTLPGIDGFETARLIRSIGSLNTVPIIFLSDYPDRAERYKAFAVGGSDYLIKPLDLDRLDNILEKFLFSPNR